MKRVFSLLAIASLLSVAGFASDPVAKGKTHSSLGNYVIEYATSPVMVDGDALKSFVVSYENSDMTIKVGIDKSNEGCKTYIVCCDNLTIQYDCNGEYFGVNKVKKQYLEDGFVTDRQALNREEYFHQKVITQLEKEELDHVKLISVYFPRLVKDYETVFAVK